MRVPLEFFFKLFPIRDVQRCADIPHEPFLFHVEIRVCAVIHPPHITIWPHDAVLEFVD